MYIKELLLASINRKEEPAKPVSQGFFSVKLSFVNFDTLSGRYLQVLQHHLIQSLDEVLVLSAGHVLQPPAADGHLLHRSRVSSWQIAVSKTLLG